MSKSAMAALREAGAFSPAILNAAEKRLSSTQKDGRIRDEAARTRMYNLLDTEIEDVWTKNKAPKEALDEAMQKYNAGKK
jgi:hypothetical protein